jgi:hypothetical protein
MLIDVNQKHSKKHTYIDYFTKIVIIPIILTFQKPFK